MVRIPDRLANFVQSKCELFKFVCSVESRVKDFYQK